MYTLDHQLSKNAYAERLRQAEHERFVHRLLAKQPKWYARLLEKLGDLLVTAGTNLKAQLPQELVEA